MDTLAYLEKFSEMQKKISQAVGIYNKLDTNKELYLERLRNCIEGKDMLVYLINIKNIYDREIRVLQYCKAGIERAREIIDQAREEILPPKSIPKIIGQFISRKVGRLINKIQKPRLKPEVNEDLELLIELSRALYAEISKEIKFLESNIEIIENHLNKQRRAISDLITLGEKEILVGNIAWFDEYKQFELDRFKEFEFLKGIEKKSKKARIISKINNINLILKRSGWYLKVKPIVWAGTSSFVSWPTSFALVGIGVLSMQFAWVGVIPFAVLRWAPDMALIAKEWKNL